MAKRKRGRPRKDGPRDNGRLIPADKIAPPPPHIARRRSLFADMILEREPQFVTNDEGELRPIDNTSDGIGQLWLLGMLDGHGFDGRELRDIGREWRDKYTTLMGEINSHAAGTDERVSSSKDWARHAVGCHRLSRSESARFDRMDSALIGYERQALMSLLIDPIVGSWPDGEQDSPWVRGIIAEGLLERKRVVAFARFPDCNDRAMLQAAIRGLCQLKDASLPSRWEQRRVA